MPVYVKCPVCTHPAVVHSCHRGSRLRCRQCGASFVIPEELTSSAGRRDGCAPGGAKRSPGRR